MKKICSLLLCLVVTLAPCFSHGQRPAQSAQGADGTPFKLLYGFLIVFQGRIGNFTDLNFVLDTGATRSTVNTNLARKMRVPPHSTQVFDFDRFVTMRSGAFPDAQFGPVHVTDVSLIVTDFSRFSDLTYGVDAIIGSDLLSLSNFSIDYDTRKLLFAPVQSSGPLLKTYPVAMIIQLQVQGRPLDLLVDTGIESVVLFEDRLRNRIPQARTQGNVADILVGRRSRAKQAILPDVRLGSLTTELKVLLIKGPQSDALPGIDGYWSTSSLKARRIDFNFATKSLSWQEWNPRERESER